MKRVSTVRTLVFLLGLAIALPFSLIGCGDSSSGGPEGPVTPPSDKAKGSMDFYREKMKNSKKGKR
ncbi:hypothetical protein [Singulisphaera sp. PoT]|uniref:hypothetical protein n=1 Tax=Singulisphaera sp. PoT TaxID=3411797 RepID=UPI003BF5E96D